MLSKTVLKEWFYEEFLTSIDKEAEMILFADTHDLLEEVTKAIACGRFDNFFVDPTFEELKQIIWEL